ncbi:MAG: oligosaccharyl transferase, archaeosortase A system-associated [Methanomicrobiales archaeon]|nr:oligosaccharyl transferase, archaeosortase A system-associated [Methanomicrobiales archaeon]
MNLSRHLNAKFLFILIVLLFLAIFALWMRVQPAFNNPSGDILDIVGSDDPMYNLRQVEQMLHNYPGYGWFEAMTLFPTGQIIHWGPLFPWIIATLCLVTGASTRPDIVSLALLVPPLMAAFMVPLIFIYVRRLTDWKTGLIAAAFIAVIAGQYFFRSLYGYLDHHIAEVLFSTLFAFCYCGIVHHARDMAIVWKNFSTWRVPFLLSIGTGVAFILGLLVMPTMILFAFISLIFTVLQFCWDFHKKHTSDYLLLVNGTVFGIVTLLFFIFGPVKDGLQLDFYTLGHPLAYILVIVTTLVLWVLSRLLRNKNTFIFIIAIVAIALLATLFLIAAFPIVYQLITSALDQFFSQSAQVQTIQEARPWSAMEAWTTFSYSLILMAGGFFVMLWRVWRDHRPDHLFVLVWSVVMLYATIQHIRYEYFLAVNIVILAAVCVGFAVNWAIQDLGAYVRQRLAAQHAVAEVEKSEDLAQKGQKVRGKKREQKDRAQIKVRPGQTAFYSAGLLVLVVVISLLFVETSVGFEYAVGTSGAIRMVPDWRESLEWLGANTPDTGVDYYTIYSQKDFKYPSTAYGVMSWWDYGHLITYIAKRIPNANPFQAGIGSESGPGASSFFITRSEENATKIADSLGTKYIMTDIEMDTGKFWAMTTWYNTTAGPTPYQVNYLAPLQGESSSLSPVTLYTPLYYETMVSRLHNFDGSMAEPGNAFYIEYLEPGAMSGYSMPVIRRAESLPGPDAVKRAEEFNKNPQSGMRAAAVNSAFFTPITKIPALQNFRLIYESSRNVLGGEGPDIRYVKVYEYVPGARIKGEGLIEVPLLTDGGRQFVYRQESVNGEFVVPYATSGSSYGVKSLGKYRVNGTGLEYEVPDQAVVRGDIIT